MLIIAPCSSKKQIFVTPELDASSIYADDLKEFSEKWVVKVKQAKDNYKPTDVYAGTGVSASKTAAEVLGADLQFLSAGLSLISTSKLIPGYNLTISNQGPNPFSQVESSGSFQDWWDCLNKAFGYEKPLLNIIHNHDEPVYISLPLNYLTMVEKELTLAINMFPNRVRIITSTKIDLNSTLASVAIRYDQRLNTAPNGPSGANASFSQRALLNFARVVKKHSAENESVLVQQNLVNKFFKNMPIINAEKRQKVTEDRLFTMIQSALATKEISSHKLLENFRKVKGIACEQSRFKRVYEEASKLRA